MKVRYFQKCLKDFDESYVVTMLGKKAQHNIDMFKVVDNKNKVVIADITVNGDLTLNDDYKHNHKMMNLIISFFSTNAKVENTYTY